MVDYSVIVSYVTWLVKSGPAPDLAPLARGRNFLEYPVIAALAQLIVLSIVDERIPVRSSIGFARPRGAHHGRLLASNGKVAKGLDLGCLREKIGHENPFRR